MKALRGLAVTALGWLVLMTESVMAGELPANYAESVMIGSLSADGREDFSLRLARFPDKGTAHVWFHFASGDEAWSVVDESFRLTREGATPVADNDVLFAGERAGLNIAFESSGRSGDAMAGRVSGIIGANRTRHPANAPGRTPVEIDVSFSAASAGYRSRSNRWELTGRVSGWLEVSGQRYRLDHDHGKWHEQIGPRAQFAPAFTYLNLQNDALSLLAIGFDDAAAGYVLTDGDVVDVEAFSIDPEGVSPRDFLVTLKDGRRIAGAARAVQEWSVEIEGRRRPGSSVIAETPFGDLLGSLNDWRPEP